MSQLPIPSVAICDAAQIDLLAGLTLTPNQLRFAIEYVKDFNPKEAAIRAGQTQKAASKHAWEMLRVGAVADAVSRLTRVEMDARQLSVTRVLNEVESLAFARIGDVIEVHGSVVIFKDWESIPEGAKAAIAEVANVKDADGMVGVKVRFHNKLEALTLLMKHMGMLIERREVSGPGGGPIPVHAITDEDLERIIANTEVT